VVLMTIYCPRLCRRSSATWTLATTMVALALWLVAPESWRVLPHPIYLAWLVSVVTFLLVAVIDQRPIKPVAGSG
jgi:SSS family solute:Na+ symporter